MDERTGYRDGSGTPGHLWTGRNTGMPALPASANSELNEAGHAATKHTDPTAPKDGPAGEWLPAVLSRSTILTASSHIPDHDSMTWWLRLYWSLHVDRAPTETARAKNRDLNAFARFFVLEVGSDRVDDWTPSVSRSFSTHLSSIPSKRSGNPLTATTINRICASVRHFGRWLQRERPLLAGNPLTGLKPMATESPDWKGLTPLQIRRLQIACEQRTGACTRKDQEPRLEAAVFLTLLHTGLREHELVRLNLADYHHRAFHHVKRKGHKVSRRVPVPGEAREVLDRYIEEVRSASEGQGVQDGALFVSRRGVRLTTRAVAYICARLARQACTNLSEADRFHLAPHQLGHTFLKRIADKHGLHHAHALSGNINVREIFRYTKPSDDEMAEATESLFA